MSGGFGYKPPAEQGCTPCIIAMTGRAMIGKMSRSRSQHFWADLNRFCQLSRSTRNGEEPQSAGNEGFCASWFVSGTDTASKDIRACRSDGHNNEQ
jgi:hypothetical protein